MHFSRLAAIIPPKRLCQFASETHDPLLQLADTLTAACNSSLFAIAPTDRDPSPTTLKTVVGLRLA
jgi:hypothetical protein